MTDTPFLNHRAVKELMAACKVDSLHPNADLFLDAIDPITQAIVPDDADVSTKGYLATNDGRIIFRIVRQAEAQERFGADAPSLSEVFMVVERLSRLGELELAAVAAQRRAVGLLKAATLLWSAHQGKTALGRKDTQWISSLLHQIAKEDRESAEQVAAMKLATAEAARDRKHVINSFRSRGL